jgi:hypothetical protein
MQFCGPVNRVTKKESFITEIRHWQRLQYYTSIIAWTNLYLLYENGYVTLALLLPYHLRIFVSRRLCIVITKRVEQRKKS